MRFPPLADTANLPAVLRRTHVQALVALTAGAALLRFATLAVQSYWYDEAITVHLVRRSFDGMLDEIPDSESTPPLYYILAHGWASLFGTSEAALRSLSAVFGTATVPVAYVAATSFVSRRSSLIAAAFVASSPFLIWYSQEARAYALLVLLATLSLVFVGRVADGNAAKPLTLWAITSTLAIIAHYFAFFVIVGEAVWLLFRFRDVRAVRNAVAAVAMASVLVAPLAVYQAKYSTHTAWIGNAGNLDGRVAYFLHQLVVGAYPASHIRPLIAAVPVVVLVGLFVWTDRAERGGALLMLSFGLAAIVPAFVLAAIGDVFFDGRGDYFIFRNMIAATVPFTIAAAATLGTARAGRVGIAVATVACLSLVAISIEISRRPELQRPNVRGLATTLGRSGAARAIVVDERTALVMTLYRPELRPLMDEGTYVREIDIVQERENSAAPPLPSPFRQVETRDVRDSRQWFRIVRTQAPRLRFVTESRLRQTLPSSSEITILLERPRSSPVTARRSSSVSAFVESSATNRNDLASFAIRSRMPIQEARCRSGSGSCSG